MKKSLTKLFTLLGAFLLLGVGSANAGAVHLRGDQFGWENNDNNELFLKSGSSTVYERIFPFIQGDKEFKIYDTDWRGQTGDGGMKGGDSWKLNGGNNVKTGASMFNVTFSYDTSNQTLTIKGTGQEFWALHGQFVNTDFSQIFLTKTSDRIWKSEPVSTKGTGEFGVVKVDAKSNQTAWYSNGGTLTTTAAQTQYINRSTNSKYSLTDNKKYIFTWDEGTNTLSVEEAPQWTLQASYTDQNNVDREIVLLPGTNANEWTASFQANSEDGWSQFAIYDNFNNKTYTLNDLTLSDLSLSGTLTEWGTSSNQNKSHFRLQQNLDYTITWNSVTHVVTLSYQHAKVYPETFFVTGQVNNDEYNNDWDARNVKEMKKIEDADGKFELGNLILVKDDSQINFCASNNAKNGTDYDGQRPQFGANSTSGDITVSVPDTGSAEGEIIEINAQPKSFKLPAGNYDVTVDLTTVPMKVTFTKNAEIELSWHNEDDKVTSENGEHNFVGFKNKDQLTIKVEDSTTHEAIKLANITVTKENSSRNVRAAAATDDYEISDDNVITFKTAGTYNVKAELPENTMTYHTAQPLALTATILETDLSPVAAPQSESFNPDSKTYTFEGAVTIDASLTQGTDFTVAVTPVLTDSQKGWITGSNYEDALPASLYTQLTNLGTTNVDGFYVPAANVKLTQDGSTNNYDFSADFACSGVYKVTVTSTDETYSFDPIEFNVTIKPNLYAKFGNDFGFSINGYTFKDEDHTIVYPQEVLNGLKNGNTNYAEECICFIPGTYFVETFTAEADIESNGGGAGTVGLSEKRNVPSLDDYGYAYRADVNLSGLQTNGTGDTTSTATVTVTVSKNGASDTFSFVVDTKGDPNTETGVDSVEAAEDGEAVYYNLQGVRVENPTHGIYVKVVDGKAVKVVL